MLLASAEEEVLAKWNYQLASSRQVGDKSGELSISSSVYTGMLGINASVRFGQTVKVKAWGKTARVISEVYQRPDEPDGPKYKEQLTATLYETGDPKEWRVEYE